MTDKLTLYRSSLLAAVTLIAVAAVLWHAVSAQDADDASVQVRARLVESGRIEFGLRADGDDLTPAARFFPAGDEATNWLVSSPLTLSNDAEVRIIARRDARGRVEFGVRSDDPRGQFLPRQRFFPPNARVGRWLISTPVSIPSPVVEPAAPQPEPEPEQPTAAEPPDDADDQGAPTAETISGGHRDGLLVERRTIGDPDAPVLIVEYGDPY